MSLRRPHLFSLLFLSLFLLGALCSPPGPRPASTDDKKFQQLLADIDDSSIHSVLHKWSTKFQDGVFSKDRTALEHVHSQDAPLATRLIQIAKRANNGTTTTTSTSPSSQTKTTTPAHTPKTTKTTEASTTPTSQKSPPTPTLTPTPTPTSSVVVSPTSTEVPTSVTLVTAEQSSATVIITATGSNGEQSTSTSVTVVGVDVTTVVNPTALAAASGTVTPTPGLANGGPSLSWSQRQKVMALLAGAVTLALIV